MIWQFAHFLEEEWHKQGIAEVAVYAEVMASLKRPYPPTAHRPHGGFADADIFVTAVGVDCAAGGVTG